MQNLKEFIDKSRTKGLEDNEIRQKLLGVGWEESDVDKALGDDLDIPLPPGKNSISGADNHHASQPISVVQNLSVRGFEYMVMFITLLASAFSIGALAHSYVDDIFSKASDTYYYGQANDANTFVVTVLIVCFPIFVYLFLRLKKAELANPALRRDPSRRKLSQLTQLVAFLFGIGYVIYFIYSLLSPDTYGDNPGVGQQLLHTLVTLTIAGSIFIYLWREDHRGAEGEV